MSDFTQRQEADLRREDTGYDETPGGPRSEFPALQERLRHLGDRFRTRLQILLGDLAYQPDVDLRFLGVSMNFNDVYQPIRRKVKGTPAPATAPATCADREKGKEREKE